MFNILCITNRKLCNEDFLERIEKIAASKPSAIILREKDLCYEEYLKLAKEVLDICKRYNTLCILHSYPTVAKELGVKALHLPLHRFTALTEEEKSDFEILGVSCHSVDDAKKAVDAGCSYIIAGHIFDTKCKHGLPGRGLDFLSDVCRNTAVPVYAIGGISPDNVAQVKNSGADGACVMSSIMQCENVCEYISSMKAKIQGRFD